MDKDEVTSKANNSTNESKIEEDIQTIVENLNASKLDLKTSTDESFNNSFSDCHQCLQIVQYNTFQCNLCTKIFTNKHSLKNHLRIHTCESCVIQLFCKQCYKSIPIAINMVKHIKIHTGESCMKKYIKNTWACDGKQNFIFEVF